jgi:AAA family ATP:ADP antiporter
MSFPALSALAFAVLFAYELARAPIDSAFLDAHGKEGLPWVWAGVGLSAVLAVTVYNRLAARLPLSRVLLLVAGASVAALAVLAAMRAADVPYATALLYVWKDVHVVVLLEIAWSFANVTFQAKTARLAYGFFCAFGSAGSVTGGLVIGAIVRLGGTDFAIVSALPVLAAITVAALFVPSGVAAVAKPAEAPPKHADGLALLAKSSYLSGILALVLITQVAITLVDYAYNEMLERTFADVDARTVVIGQIQAWIGLGSIALGIGTAPVLYFAGVRRTMIAIPLIVGAAVALAAVSPVFAVIAVAKIASKTFDYSIFRAAKENLYIPLSYAEKTRGKAMIDMLTYRVAKVGASLLLGGFIVVGYGEHVLLLVLALVAAWLVVVAGLTRRYQELVAGRAEG